MSVHLRVFIAILVLGVAGIVGWRWVQPWLADRAQRQTSDAAGMHGSLRIGVDNWVGYFPLCSPEMARRLRAKAWVLDCQDDQADVPKRVRKLAEGQLDFAVSTIDSWLLNGPAQEFPGAIIAVIDQSQGGDAIVARRSKIASLEDLKAHPETRIALSPLSPSEHLLKSVAVDFDLPQLNLPKNQWRLDAQGSSDALADLESGKADVAVLWEPDVSRALADADFVKLIGTEDTEGLIVDVLVASRRILQEHPDAVQTLVATYFETLAHYQSHRDQLASDLARSSNLDADQVRALLGGVAWASLEDNGAVWFGIAPSGVSAPEALSEALRDTAGVLVAAGDFSSSPLPANDPYRLTNRQFVADGYLPAGGASAKAIDFQPLDDAGWAALRPVGILRLEAVSFRRGTASLDDEGRRALDAVAERLRNYPRYRLLIRGHTGVGGDAQANVDLSAQRAAAVLDDLIDRHKIDPERLRAVGLGGSQPLPRLPDESDRAYSYRLPRVEFQLLTQ